MKKYLAIIFVLFFSINAFQLTAQNQHAIDSLTNLLNDADSKKQKIDLLVKISAIYSSTNKDEAITQINNALELAYDIEDTSLILLCIGYKADIDEDLGNNQKAINLLNKGLLIAKEYGDKNILSDYFLRIGWLHEIIGDYHKALDYFERRLKIKIELDDKEGISITHNYLGIIYEEMGEYSLAIQHFNKSLNLAKKLNLSELISHAYNNLGLVYDYQGSNDSALIYYNKSLDIERKSNNKQGIADGLINIGTVYQEMGNFKRAIDLFNEGMSISKDINYDFGVAMSINNLGEVHIQLGNYDIALKYFMQSLRYDEKSGDKDEIAISLMNVGDAYIHLKKHDSAFYYLDRSLKISKEIGDHSSIANSLSSMASLFVQKEEYNTALDKYKEVLDIHKSLGEKDRISNDLIRIGEIHFRLKNYKSAEDYITQGLEIALQYDFKEDVKIAAEILSKIYAEVRDFERAYINHVLFKQMYDSIFTLESKKKLSALETRFELEKKKQEIERQTAKIAQQKRQQIRLTIGLVIVLIAVIIAFVLYIRIRKAKNIIDYQRQEILESNEELKQINEELRTTIETVNSQKEEIEAQRDKIEVTNSEITASIHYAKYIQSAILPNEEKRTRLLNKHFILNKPKQIVSGDFYWATEIKNKTILATADSTGHGVPGAFMSLLGISFLNDVVNREGLTNPAGILERLREEIIHALNQKGTPGEARDGMDMSICTVDFTNMKLQYAGANNPLYVVRSNKLEPINDTIVSSDEHYTLYELKGERTTIAYRKNMIPFTFKQFKLFKGDKLYLFTDGYIDQFEEKSGKKFGSDQFKKLLISIHNENMDKQLQTLESSFNKWKGNFDQIDDVLVLGFEI